MPEDHYVGTQMSTCTEGNVNLSEEEEELRKSKMSKKITISWQLIALGNASVGQFMQ
jgi:hypothetical protein